MFHCSQSNITALLLLFFQEYILIYIIHILPVLLKIFFTVLETFRNLHGMHDFLFIFALTCRRILNFTTDFYDRIYALKRLKKTQVVKVRFIKMKELKLTHYELFSFFHFKNIIANIFELFCMAHLANNEPFLYSSDLSS